MNASPDAALAAVREAERRGEVLQAFDLAEQALALWPGDIRLQHRAVLALARAGSTTQAASRFAALGLDSVGLRDEDIAALGARLAKDHALGMTGGERSAAALHAAALYAEIATRNDSYYPRINAATLELIGGRPLAAAEHARAALSRVDRHGDSDYWAWATRAEAHLLLRDEAAAVQALEQAYAVHGDDHGAVASTRRQLSLICVLTGADPSIVLAPLGGPGVVHFCGHVVAAVGAAGRFPSDREGVVAASIKRVVAEDPPAYAYGGLANGGDLLWAEALLEAGAQLHVVLPFAVDAYVAASVRPAGEQWVARFSRCLEAATDVRYATADAQRPDEALFRHGSELAMGLAMLHARRLEVRPRQLAVWDGEPPATGSGTAVDLARWKAHGLESTIVTVDGGQLAEASELNYSAGVEERGRVIRTMLFADFHGFSRLDDDAVMRFVNHVLPAMAAVLNDYDDDVIVHRNTWGDGIFVVFTDPGAAARCALRLVEADVDLGSAMLPPDLRPRVALHVGPVFRGTDPIRGEPDFFGTHVSRTARIEPVTPPGSVFVSEAFAAILELDVRTGIACDYVGHMPAAKEYGRLRMYSMRLLSTSS